MRRADPRIIHRRPELSQHFLRERGASSLVRHAALPPGALVVEPGAGSGAITAALAAAGHRVIAVERDPVLGSRLRKRFGGNPSVSVRLGDALAFEMPREPYPVVSNVPYAITAALMRTLLQAARPPDTATLILQREAVQKFVGWPRETLFSLLHKPAFAFESVANVPRGAFVPPPRVESSVLRIVRRDRPLLAGASAWRYRSFVESAFGHGSGAFGATLRPSMTARQVRRIAHGMGVAPDARISQLTFEQWLVIFRFVEHECLGHDPTRAAA
jgi:23S rRNA (adenine-N6)-dimethyltransferase